MISATEAARITEDNSFDTEDERLFANALKYIELKIKSAATEGYSFVKIKFNEFKDKWFIDNNGQKIAEALKQHEFDVGIDYSQACIGGDFEYSFFISW